MSEWQSTIDASSALPTGNAAVNGFSMTPFNMALLGQSSPVGVTGSMTAMCTVSSSQPATSSSWMYIGNQATCNTTAFTSVNATQWSKLTGCGCWACIPTLAGAYTTQILTGIDLGNSNFPALADTWYPSRWAIQKWVQGKGEVTVETAKNMLIDAINSTDGGFAPVVLRSDIMLDSESMGYLQAQQDLGATCLYGYKMFALGAGSGITASKMLYFCAPSATVSAAQSDKRFLYVVPYKLGQKSSSGRMLGVTTTSGSQVTYYGGQPASCTKCAVGQYQSRRCSYTDDTICTTCYCSIPETHPKVICDGSQTDTPVCVKCADDYYKGDGFGNNFQYYFVHEDGRPRSVYTCGLGTYNTRSGVWGVAGTDVVSRCDGVYGWDVTDQVCAACNPPRAPFAVTPYPQIGTDEYAWTCAPGFSPLPVDGQEMSDDGMSVMRQCPVADNNYGSGWIGSPIQCGCNGIGDTHTCSHNSTEGWVQGTDPTAPGAWTSLRYTVGNGSDWAVDASALDSTGRGDLLAAVRFVFEMPLVNGSKLVYEFKMVSDPIAWQAGEVQFNNDEQYYSRANARAGYPFEHAVAVLRVYTASSQPPTYRALLRAKSTATSTELESWFGAESAIKAKMPNAHGYFVLTQGTGDFWVEARIQALANGTYDAQGLLDRHIQREIDAGVRPEQNRIKAFYASRSVVSVKFDWLTRKCPAGQYQIGDTCTTCPSGYYNDRTYITQKYLAGSRTLWNITGSSFDNALCAKCQCTGCTFCNPESATCEIQNNTCQIGGKCMVGGTPNPSAKCSWCAPDVSQVMYSVMPEHKGCDDNDECSFFDTCDGSGHCTGTKADCLNDATTPQQNCEICGHNMCSLSPSFGGCVYYYSSNSTNATSTNSSLGTGSVTAVSSYTIGRNKTCGCSIAGVCYPHGAERPGNPCQVCDVANNPRGWSDAIVKACDDGNACTYGDMCLSGKCSGHSITCKPEGPCAVSSTCQGTDTCNVVYKSNATVCQAGEGFCTPPAFCSGASSVCPPRQVVQPLVSAGDIQLLPVPERLDSVEPVALASVPVPGAAASTIPSFGYPVTNALYLGTLGWTAPCAGLSYRFGLISDPDGGKACTAEAVSDIIGGGLGFSAWTASATMIRAGYDYVVPGSSAFAMTLSRTDLNLRDGDVLKLRVEARSEGAGSTTSSVAYRCARLVVDASPPSAGTVRNVNLGKLTDDGTDAAYVSTANLGFTWSGFVEDQYSSTWSGLLRYQYTIGTTPGATDVIGWRWVNFAQSSHTDAYLDVLPRYVPLYVTVRAINKAGLTAYATGSAVVIDDTGPTAGIVFDGIQEDNTGAAMQKRYITSDDIDNDVGLAVQWSGFKEEQTWIDHYEVAWGFGSGGQSLMPFTTVPGGSSPTSAQLPFKQWKSANRYVATVRAVSVSGAYTDVSTDGIWYDTTPPQNLALTLQQQYIPCADRLQFPYTYVEDSGIFSATVWAGRTLEDSDLVPVTVITESEVTNGVTLPPLYFPPSDGMQLYVHVQLTNLADLNSDIISRLYALDCSPPVSNPAATIAVAPSQPSATSPVYFHSDKAIAVSWDTCTDLTSGIAGYDVRVTTNGALANASLATGPAFSDFGFGTTVASTSSALIEVLPWTSASGATLFSLDAVMNSLVPGYTYYSQVRCTNGAGSSVVSSTAGQVMDWTAPVLDGFRLSPRTNASAFYWHSVQEVTVVWKSIVDAESGVASMRAAIGTPTGGPSAEVFWIDLTDSVAASGSYTFTGLALTQGYRYTVTVQVTNRAGLVSNATTPAFTVDASPPLLGMTTLVDGLGATDIDYALDMSYVSANWTGTCSDPQSGLAKYTFCVGSGPGACDIVSQMDLPPNTTYYTATISAAAAQARLCAISSARMLVDEHPIPAAVHELRRLHSLDHMEHMNSDVDDTPAAVLSSAAHRRLLPAFGISASTTSVSRFLEASSLHMSRDLAVDPRQYSAKPYDGPAWSLAIADQCTGAWATSVAMSAGLRDYVIQLCIGGPVSIVTPITLSDFVYYNGWERSSVVDGLATLTGVIKYVGYAYCTGAPGFWTMRTAMQCSDTTATSGYVSSVNNTDCTINWVYSTPLACNKPLTHRIAGATAVGPTWLQQQYTGLCITTVLVNTTTGTSNNGVSVTYEVCPFNRVRSWPTSNPSALTLHGYFDSWAYGGDSGAATYQHQMYVDGDVCSSGRQYKRAKVEYVCSLSGQPKVLSVVESIKCVESLITVAVPELCDPSHTLGVVVPSHTPLPSVSALPSPSMAPSVLPSSSPSASPAPVIPGLPHAVLPLNFYGPTAFASLPGTCYSIDIPAPMVSASSNTFIQQLYKVNLCPFKNVTGRWGYGAQVSLGLWAGWTTNTYAGRTAYDRWQFMAGSTCTKPDGSTAPYSLYVSMQCPNDPTAPAVNITSINEAGDCVVRMTVAVQAACAISNCAKSPVGRTWTTVNCINNAGMPLPNGPMISDGVTFDPFPPTKGLVAYGAPAWTLDPVDGGWISPGLVSGPKATGAVGFSAGPLSFSIRDFKPALAPLRGYSVSLGSTVGGTDLVPRIDIGAGTLVQVPQLTLTDGAVCYTTVTAFTGAGIGATVGADFPAVFDSSNPTVLGAVIQDMSINAPVPAPVDPDLVMFGNSTGSSKAVSTTAQAVPNLWLASSSQMRVCAVGAREPDSQIVGARLFIGDRAFQAAASAETTMSMAGAAVGPSSRVRTITATELVTFSPKRTQSVLSGAGLQMNQGAASELTAATSPNRVDVSRSFRVTWMLKVQKVGSAAVGEVVSMFLHNDPRGVRAIGNAAGTSGGIQAVSSYDAMPPRPAVAQMVSTNPGLGAQYPWAMGFFRSDTMGSTSNLGSNFYSPSRWTDARLPLASGVNYAVTLEYNAVSRNLTMSVRDPFDASTAVGPFVNTLDRSLVDMLNSTTAWIGFAASTGSGVAIYSLPVVNMTTVGLDVGVAFVEDLTPFTTAVTPDLVTPSQVGPLQYPTTVCTTFRGLTLQPGRVVTGTLSLVNIANLTTNATFTFTSDPSPPYGLNAFIGKPSLAAVQNSGKVPLVLGRADGGAANDGTGSYNFNLPFFFTPAIDDDTGVTSYWAAVGSQPGLTDITNWTSTGLGTSTFVSTMNALNNITLTYQTQAGLFKVLMHNRIEYQGQVIGFWTKNSSWILDGTSGRYIGQQFDARVATNKVQVYYFCAQSTATTIVSAEVLSGPVYVVNVSTPQWCGINTLPLTDPAPRVQVMSVNAGPKLAVLNATVPAVLLPGQRAFVSVRAFNGAGYGRWLDLSIPVASIAVDASAVGDFVFDDTAPIFDISAPSWPMQAPATVRPSSSAATSPPGTSIWPGQIAPVLGFTGVTGQTNVTVSWAPLADPHSPVTGVAVRLMRVNPSSASEAPPVAMSAWINASDVAAQSMVINVTAATRGGQLDLYNAGSMCAPVVMTANVTFGRFTGTTKYPNGVPVAIVTVTSNVTNITVVNGTQVRKNVTVTTSRSNATDLSSCCALCESDRECVAYAFNNATNTSTRCVLASTYLELIPSRNTSVGSYRMSRPVYVVQVAATNYVNLQSIVQTPAFVVDMEAPKLPAAAIVVDPQTCIASEYGALNLTSLQQDSMKWTGAPTDANPASVCIVFPIASDAASGIAAYTIALGTTPGSDDVLQWTQVTGDMILNQAPARKGVSVYNGTSAVSVASFSTTSITHFRILSPAFRAPSYTPVYASVRSYDGAGNAAAGGPLTSPPILLLSAPPSPTTNGFQAWIGPNRTTTFAVDPVVVGKRISLSWTGPGGDPAVPTWTDPAFASSSVTAAVPGGLNRFDVGISTTRDESGLMVPPGWVAAGVAQSAVLGTDVASIFYTCGTNPASSASAAGYYGWSLLGAPWSEADSAYPTGVRVADERACCDVCTQSSRCVGWTFKLAVGGAASNCFPVSKAGVAAMKRGVISGVVAGASTLFNQPSTYDTSLPGHIMTGVMPGPARNSSRDPNNLMDYDLDATACMNKCHASPTCMAWSVTQPLSDFSCKLFGSSTSLDNSDPFRVTGFVGTRCSSAVAGFHAPDGEAYDPSIDYSDSGTVSSDLVSTQQECCDACSASTTCALWKWNATGSSCQLLTDMGSQWKAAAAITVGSKMAFAPTDTCSASQCSSLVFPGVDVADYFVNDTTYASSALVNSGKLDWMYPLASSWMPLANSVSSCCAICNQTAECSAAVYNGTHCKMLRSYASLRAANASTTLIVVRAISASAQYGLVSAVSNKGLRTIVGTAPFNVSVAGPPMPGTVLSTRAAAGQPLSDYFPVACAWGGWIDVSGGVLNYAATIVGMSSAGKNTTLLDWRNVAAALGTNFTIPAAYIPDGTSKLFCAVRACTAAGLCRILVNVTDGVSIDTVPVIVGRVAIAYANGQLQSGASSLAPLLAATPSSNNNLNAVDKSNVAIANLTMGASVTVVWSPYTCGPLGLDSYSLCLGTRPGGCTLGTGFQAVNMSNTADLNRPTRYINITLIQSPAQSDKVYARVTANCVGGMSDSDDSAGTIVDQTPPVAPLFVGTSSSFTCIDLLKASYTEYRRVGSTLYPYFHDNVYGYTSGCLQLQSDVKSAADRYPSNPWVQKQTVINSETGTLTCAWSPGSDAESGIGAPGGGSLSYNVSISYSNDVTKTEMPWITPNRISWNGITSNEFSVTFNKDRLGSRFWWQEVPMYCVVQVTNGAGLSSYAISAPVIVDFSGPIIDSAAVLDGPDPAVDAQQSEEPPTQFTASWSGFFDKGSGVGRYEVCLGMSDKQKCNVVDWTKAQSSVRHTFANLTNSDGSLVLQLGIKYVACVRAVDNVGYYSDSVCSNGMFVDAAAPAINAVVMADANLELYYQQLDNATRGWPYAHLFKPATDATLLQQVLGSKETNGTVSVPGVGNLTFNLTTSVKQRQAWAATLKAGTRGTGFLQPRLTLGGPWGSGAALDHEPWCRVSSQQSEGFLLVPSTDGGKTRPASVPDGSVNITIGRQLYYGYAGCVAGMYRDTALDACVPCPDGYFKAQAGDGAGSCTRCPSNTFTFTASAAAVITDTSQQTRRPFVAGGPTSCACWDDSQVFDASVGCICKPGMVHNTYWDDKPPRQYSVTASSNSDADPPSMCILVPGDGVSYKDQAGDSTALVKTCPAGTQVTLGRDGCQCPYMSQQLVYNSTGGASCQCGPGRYLASFNTTTLGLITGCVACPSGTTKAGYGNNVTMCKKCPWGTLPGPTADMMGPLDDPATAGCMVDPAAVQGRGATMLPAKGSVACTPGSYAVASFTSSILSGWKATVVMSKSGNHTKQYKEVCLPISPSMYTDRREIRYNCFLWWCQTRVEYWPIIEGVSLRDIPNNQVYAVEQSKAAQAGGVQFLNVWKMPSVADKLLNQNDVQQVKILGSCTADLSFYDVSCQPCPDGQFQPNYLPLYDGATAVSTYGSYLLQPGMPGQCNYCPGLLSGTYYGSDDRTLFANWTGVFDDGAGTGIIGFEYAIGMMKGGSQIVPFTPIAAATTAVVIPADNITVVSGTPLYLTVVAQDKAGNRAVFEDSRPVIIDATAPLPGPAIDGDLDTILANMTVAAYLTATGATGSASTTSSGVVQVTDRADAPSDRDTVLVSSIVARAGSAVNALAAIPDSTLTGSNASNITRAATLAMVTAATNATLLRSNSSSRSSVGWRQDPTFVSLYGMPDADFQNFTSSYSMAWEPFLDTGSGIAAMGYCIGSLPYACDIRGMTLVQQPKLSVDGVTIRGLVLPAGQMVYGTVIAVNGVGMVSMATTNGLVADSRPPTAGIVYDTGAYFEVPIVRSESTASSLGAPIPIDIDCDGVGRGIGAAWEGFTSLIGIDRYEWAVGTCSGCTNVLPWVPLGRVSSVYNSSLGKQLPAGTRYFTSIKAVSKNGASTIVTTDGVRLLGADVDSGSTATGTKTADSMFLCMAFEPIVATANASSIVNVTNATTIVSANTAGDIVDLSLADLR